MIKIFLKEKNVSSLINCTNKKGDSALHKASRSGAEGTVRELLSCEEINTEDRNHKGETVLHVATAAGHLGIAKLLVENNSNLLGITDSFDETVFHIAAR